MKIILTLTVLISAAASFHPGKQAAHKNMVAPGMADDTSIRETRLRYPSFSLVFHNFKGYLRDEREVYRYYCQFATGGSEDEAELNDSEQGNEDYIETLIVKKDSIYLSEILFDDRINNTLMEIIPRNKHETFRISFCYLSHLAEIIDERTYSSREMIDSLYKQQFHKNERTAFYTLPDSARFFFRALPHTPDMEAVEVVNGQLTYPKRNPQKDLESEAHRNDKELRRIKEKYGLRDTLVVIPGEYDTVATLTRDKKLFIYGHDSFLFRVERFNGKKLLETRYIVIGIAYGC